MEPLIRSFSQIWKGFNSLTASKKASILAAVIVSAIGITFLVYMAGSTDYRVLFSNLGSEDAANIVSKLKEKKMEYKLSDSGNSILVPSDKVSELRLDLASSGLPQGGGVGFEIFDNKNFGVTEFVQQLNYQRALQGELARTINGLDEIQHSRVHLVIPKKSLFSEEQAKPTASVILKMKSGRSLRPAQIEGIVHLVAGSIEGLNPGDVMVIDSTGKVLSKAQDDAKLGRLSTSQMEYQRNFEKDLTTRVQTMLEKVVGEGRAVVRVSADLDFRIMEKMEEKYDPETPVIRSQQKQSEHVGPARSDAPMPVAQPGAQTGKSETKQEKSDEITNYEISKTVNKTVMPVGDIKKISIAVLVDGNYVKNSKGEEEYQPRSKKEIADLEDLVKKSAGFDSKREDQIVVTNIPFKKVELESDQVQVPIVERVSQFYPVLKYVFMLGILALVIFFFLRPLVASLKSKGTRDALAPALETGMGTALPGSGVTAELQGSGPFPMIGQEMKSYSESEIVKHLASTDARKFADLLRHWIK